MLFKSLVAAALATAATATNIIHFVNQDHTQRTIMFTGQVGQAAIQPLVLKGHATANQTFPQAWIGNWYSVSAGQPNVPGMLGEIAWNGYAGANFFDVSAIVNPNDLHGVKMIFPKNTNTPVSGCQTFPCANAYNKPDDIATLSTTDDELVCLVGTLSADKKRTHIARHTHKYVSGNL